MGLLDALTSGSSGGYGGLLDGLLSYPTQQAPQNTNFLKALLTGQSAGPTFAPAPPPPPPPLTGDPVRFAGMGAGGAMPVMPPDAASVPYAGMGAGAALPGASLPQGAPPAAPTPAPANDGPVNYMDIGGYKMPQFGSPSDYMPKPQPMQSAPASMPTAPQSAQPSATFLGAEPGGGIGDRLSAGLYNLGSQGSGGLLTRVANGISGLATGQRTDPVGMQMQNQRAQYSAFINAGLTPQEAMLAVLNPEAGKTLINEALTSKEKYQVVSEDPFAGKKYGFVNERAQTVDGKPINAPGGTSSSPLVDMERAKAAGVQGEALYDYLPKQIAPMVKAMIEGRQPLPTGAAMRNPATLALIDAAHSVDPTFDATSWGARAAGAKDFTSGKSSEMVRAANQTLAHVGSLLDSMESLRNRRVPVWNAVANTYDEATGGGNPGAFRTNAHAVAEEMSKVFKGANLSDSEIRHWEQNLSANMSPDQQRAQVAKLSELLHGSLQALDEKRVAAIGPMAASKAGPIIKPEGQKMLERIDSWVKANGAPQQAAPSAAPAGGLPAGWSVKVR